MKPTLIFIFIRTAPIFFFLQVYPHALFQMFSPQLHHLFLRIHVSSSLSVRCSFSTTVYLYLPAIRTTALTTPSLHLPWMFRCVSIAARSPSTQPPRLSPTWKQASHSACNLVDNDVVPCTPLQDGEHDILLDKCRGRDGRNVFHVGRRCKSYH